MTTSLRPALMLAATAAVLLLLAAPAAAHTRAAAASDFDSRILRAPDVPGVSWRTYAGGDLLELVVDADVEVVVLGYEGEPYLRVGPQGVAVNRNSPATYLNAERYADVAVPPRADAEAAPEWRRVSAARSHAWHDHRIHWMSPALPPAVRTAPDRPQRLLEWSVDVEVQGVGHALVGELWWEPGGAAWPWLAVASLVTAPAVLGVARTSAARAAGRRARSAAPLAGTRTAVRPAAAVVAAVAGFNAVHLADELLSWPAPTLDIAFGVLHTTLFVGTALAGAAISWQGRHGPLLSLGIASGAVLFHQGLLQLRLLTASQLPTIWPDAVLRTAVALSIAQAVWVAAVVAVCLRAGAGDGRPAPEAAAASGPAGSPTARPQSISR